jgi:hypothetical protein
VNTLEFNHPDDAQRAYEEATKEGRSDEFKLDFSAFILSLSSTVLVAIGTLPDPISKEVKKNIPLAKQMIDVINMLKEKTKGNLTKEENELISSLSTDLKMKYLQAVDFK